MAEYEIGKKQAGGVQHKTLFGVTTYTFGQQGGVNTVDPAMDALEAFWKTDIEAVGVGLPNGLGDPSFMLNALGAHKRFVIFGAPLVPYSGGSMDRLVNSSTYDAAHHLSAQKIVAAGYTDDNACRFGHEYNAGSTPGNYVWATGHIDPYTGNPVTIATYKAAAKKVEEIYRSEGWLGYAAWSGGTSDTSALPIEDAIPTHGDPAKTIWDYDSYIGTKYGTTKNDYASGWPQVKNAWDKYAAYCHANGLMMASSEFNAHTRVPSPYMLNDAAGALYFPDIYALFQKYAYLMAWASLYQVQQFTGSYIDEEHAYALSVNSSGIPAGVSPTAEYTAPYPPGKSDLISGSGSNSLALSGSLDNSSQTGLNWVRNPSKNIQHRLDAFEKTFGGFGTTGGAAGLTAGTPVSPAIPPTAPVATLGKKRTTRRQYSVYK